MARCWMSPVRWSLLNQRCECVSAMAGSWSDALTPLCPAESGTEPMPKAPLCSSNTSGLATTPSTLPRVAATTRPLDKEGLFPAPLHARCSSPNRSHQHQDLPLFSSHLPLPGHSMLLHPSVVLVLLAASLILPSGSSSFSPTQTCCLCDCTRASLASFGQGGKDSVTVHPLAWTAHPISLTAWEH